MGFPRELSTQCFVRYEVTHRVLAPPGRPGRYNAADRQCAETIDEG